MDKDFDCLFFFERKIPLYHRIPEVISDAIKRKSKFGSSNNRLKGFSISTNYKKKKTNHEYRAEKKAVPSDLRICTMSHALLGWQPDQKGI